MSKIFLNNQVLIYLLGESVSLLLFSIAAFFSAIIIKKWDFNSYSLFQFKLENRAYLISTIVEFLLYIKIALIIYFIYTIDALSILVPGAMCGAGVISANSYGLNLLFVKLLIIFLLMFYINLNNYDLEAKDYPVIKQKSLLVLAIFALILVEFFLDISYFSNIDLNLPVSCCSALFGQLEGANPLPFGLNITMLLALFYMLYITFVVANLTSYKWIYLIVSILFLYISYYAVVYFFGTYVYELPTHKCPFCMMQKAYYYIGYLIWGTLFLGSFLAIIYSLIALWLKSELKMAKKLSLFLITLFVIINSSYVIVYYLRNGVFL
jgi:hypothetical protein